jgi:hypothetical protein
MSWPQGCLDVIPLIRPSDTFSPNGKEGRDEGAPPNRIHQPVYRSGHSFFETALKPGANKTTTLKTVGILKTGIAK